jgi:DHA1 family bicyclomycin/chloramphenicol resistance-like MFS transporter
MQWNQQYYSKGGMIILLALAGSFSALTTDIYLPALPQLKEVLQTSQPLINLTLSLYFVFFASGMLFWGPLTEKFGRKPIFLIGLAAYTIACVGCGLSQDVYQLIGCRIIQAFSASAPTVCATAIVKDLYSGRDRERAMALIFSITYIAPIVAPILGAMLLKFMSWQAIFYLLAGIGALTLLSVCFFSETLNAKTDDSLMHSWGRLFVVLFNPNFLTLLILFSIIPVGILSFLAVSSFIYIEVFGLSEQMYSYFLAFNALFSMIGPTLYVKLSARFQPRNIIFICFSIFACCGALIITTGQLSAYLFALLIAAGSLSTLLLEVPALNLMLEQQEKDTGSATGLIAFSGMLMGSIGMNLVTLSPDNLIVALGALQLVTGLMGAVFWLLIRNRAAFRYDFHKS